KEKAVLGPRVRVRTVSRVVEAQNLAEEDHAVEVDAVPLQDGRENSVAGGAIAFTEEELGRAPTVVLRQKTADKTVEGSCIRVDAVEAFKCVFALHAAVPCAGSIDEDEVRGVEQAIRVGCDLVRPAGRMLQVRKLHAHGAHAGHPQKHRGGSRATV